MVNLPLNLKVAKRHLVPLARLRERAGVRETLMANRCFHDLGWRFAMCV